MNRVFIIAEIGVNHNGDVDLAKKLIDSAIDSGADAVKFQSFISENLVTKDAKTASYQIVGGDTEAISQYEMLKRLELNKDDMRIIKNYCSERNIIFISSPFDLETIDYLVELDLDIFKIPSGEIDNVPYLKKVGALNKEIILSTGMSYLDDVECAYNILKSVGAKDITILHCTSNYPTKPEEVNLNAIQALKRKFNTKVGYSDHTEGIEIPIAAVALRAEVIEKHFTLDKNMKGPDHKASIEPEQFKEMVKAIRNIEKAFGDGTKRPSNSEKQISKVCKKSLVAINDIKKGDKFSNSNIGIKRPGTGISPKRIEEFINKISNRDYKTDELIKDKIPLSIPNINGNEIEYVVSALKEGWVSTGGSFLLKFEDGLKKYLKVNNLVLLQSGTSAIHLALKLCDVKGNTEVIVPTLTFIATINPIRYLGGEPVFMDCDDTLNLDPIKLSSFLKEECTYINNQVINKKTKATIKAIIVTHVFGNMADMDSIMEIAEKYHLKVIEDAAEAFGGYYIAGKYNGLFAGTVGDFGIYSFNGNKIITTGGGGVLVGSSKAAINKAKYLATQAKDNPLIYIHDEIGYNYAMNNIQAAIGLAQFENVENFIKIKRDNYLYYKENIIKTDGLSLLEFNKMARNNHWFYSLVLNNYKYSKDELIKKLRAVDIETRPIWKLNHTQKPYVNCQNYKVEKAISYFEKIVNIPCSTSLTNEEIEFVISNL